MVLKLSVSLSIFSLAPAHADMRIKRLLHLRVIQLVLPGDVWLVRAPTLHKTVRTSNRSKLKGV